MTTTTRNACRAQAVSLAPWTSDTVRGRHWREAHEISSRLEAPEAATVAVHLAALAGSAAPPVARAAVAPADGEAPS